MRQGGGRRREGFRRYHVEVGGRRTTATLDKNLAGWLALRLGRPSIPPTNAPEDAATHRAIREWMQAQLDTVGAPTGKPVSDWLQAEALEAIVDPELRDRVPCEW